MIMPSKANLKNKNRLSFVDSLRLYLVHIGGGGLGAFVRVWFAIFIC